MYFHLKYGTIPIFIIEVSFSFVEILFLTHNSRKIVIVLNPLRCSNRRLLHVSFQNLKLDLKLCFPDPNAPLIEVISKYRHIIARSI